MKTFLITIDDTGTRWGTSDEMLAVALQTFCESFCALKSDGSIPQVKALRVAVVTHVQPDGTELYQFVKPGEPIIV